MDSKDLEDKLIRALINHAKALNKSEGLPFNGGLATGIPCLIGTLGMTLVLALDGDKAKIAEAADIAVDDLYRLISDPDLIRKAQIVASLVGRR